MEELIKLLDENLALEKYEIADDTIYLYVKSIRTEAVCPYCNSVSDKVHSQYERSFQDLPIQGKKTVIVINNRKMFCINKDCSKKTFAEKFNFISHKGKKSLRLEEEIVSVSQNVSSIAAARILNKNVVKVGKSTICNILKKRCTFNK
jgi:transposase